MVTIETYTGIHFDPFNPQQELIDIKDIAHALSMLCRFGGHIDKFYSVAEHSIHTCDIVPVQFALEALLHDATEAYLIDLPRPIKMMLPSYKEAEKKLSSAIRLKFGLPEQESVEVKHADNVMLVTEAREFGLQSWPYWGMPDPIDYIEWLEKPDPSFVEECFLARFDYLREE